MTDTRIDPGTTVPGDRRAPRLVTMQIAFTAEAFGGLRFEGHTTGLSVTGLAGRVKIASGTLPTEPIGIPVVIRLDLPKETEFAPIDASIIRVDPSWEPGYNYFVAFKFLQAGASDIEYLKKFICWRDDAYFTERKPVRQWYIFKNSEQRAYGPLTSDEIHAAVRIGEFSVEDLIWSPVKSEWIPFSIDLLQETLKGDEKVVIKEVEKRVEVPARAAVIVRRRGGAGWFAAAALLVAAIGGVGYGWWEGIIDWTAPASLWREASQSRVAGRSYRALEMAGRLLTEYPGHRFSARAAQLQSTLLAEDLAQHDVVAAQVRKQLPAPVGREAVPPPVGTQVVADFDNDGVLEREWESPFGSWMGQPPLGALSTTVSLNPNVRYSGTGSSLQLVYGLESLEPAYGGAWLRLSRATDDTFNGSDFKFLSFFVKGSEGPEGFTSKLKVELRSRGSAGAVVISGVGTTWKKYQVPLAQFAGLQDLAHLTEVLFVLDSSLITDQKGTFYIDDVAFMR